MRMKGEFDEFDVLFCLPTSCMTCNNDYIIGGECKADVEREPGKRDTFSCDKFDVNEKFAYTVRGETKPIGCKCFIQITAESFCEHHQEGYADFEVVIPLQKWTLKTMNSFLKGMKEIEEGE